MHGGDAEPTELDPWEREHDPFNGEKKDGYGFTSVLTASTVGGPAVASQKTPTWAVVCAVVGFFIVTVFSLFFLLAKQTVYSGVVQVTVTNGLFRYDARLPVTDQAQVQHVHTQVNYVRSLAAL